MKMTGLRLIGLTTIDLPLHGAQPSDQFILKAADGLGPVEMDVAIARGVYRRRELRDREVVLRVALNPNWFAGQTAGDLRETIYGLLNPGIGSDEVVIQIMDGTVVKAVTRGVPRLVEALNFTKDPQVQVTTPCLGPYLEGVGPIDAGPTLGTTGGSTPVVRNHGSIPVPFRARFRLGAWGEQHMSIFSGDRDKNGIHFELTYGHPAFAVDSIITIDTHPGKRKAESEKAGVKHNLVKYMSDWSVWPVLPPGDHILTVTDPVAEWYELVHTPRWWGV